MRAVATEIDFCSRKRPITGNSIGDLSETVIDSFNALRNLAFSSLIGPRKQYINLLIFFVIQINDLPLLSCKAVSQSDNSASFTVIDVVATNVSTSSGSLSERGLRSRTECNCFRHTVGKFLTT